MKKTALLYAGALALTGLAFATNSSMQNSKIAFGETATKLNAAGETVHVKTLEELQEAIGGDEGPTNVNIIFDNDIIVDDLSKLIEYGPGLFAIQIPLDHSVTIDGNGHVLSAGVTGSDEYGNFNLDATKGILIGAFGNLEIQNLTLRGGCRNAIYSESATLKVENCTIERCNSASGTLFDGGGMYLVLTNAYFENCKISRNCANFGGGFVASSSFVVMNNCSLNDNRSLGYGCGGGACEANYGTVLVMNNCSIINNTSTEIGGAINDYYESEVYLQNCTFTGNATNSAYGEQSGGGVGVNNSQLYLTNTVFSKNHFIKGTENPDVEGEILYSSEIDDIGLYSFDKSSGSSFPITSYASSVNKIYCKDSGEPSEYTDPIEGLAYKEQSDTDFFKDIKTENILYDLDNERLGVFGVVTKPATLLNELNTYSPYLGSTSQYLTGGCETYFNVPDDVSTFDKSTIMVGYKENGEYKSMGDFLAPSDETYKVTTYQDGTTRENGVMGANGTKDGDYCSLTVLPPTGYSKVFGGSVFGDILPKGNNINIYIDLMDGETFEYWEDVINVGTKYTEIDKFENTTIDTDICIRPIIKSDLVKVVNLYTTPEYKNELQGYITAPEFARAGGEIAITAYPEDGYQLCYATISDVNYDNTYFYSPGETIYALNETTNIDAYFWTGSYPTGKELPWTGEDQELVNAGVNGEIYVYYSSPDDGDFYYSLTGEEGTYSLDVPEAADDGTYTIYWKYVHAVEGDYPDRAGVVTSKIVKPDPTYTAPTAISGLTFNGEEQTLITEGTSSEGTFYYSLTGEEGSYVTDLPEAKNAGDYTVYWLLKGDESHADVSDNLDVSISKLKIAKPSEDTSTFIYNGNQQTYNVAENDYYSVTGNKATNAGDYDVTVSLIDKNNTEWADETTDDVSFDFKINKAKIAKPSEDVTTFTYNGENQTYNIASNDAYTVTNNIQKNAGSYTVTVSLKDKANYEWADGTNSDLTYTFVIEKAKVAKPAPDTSTFTYTGSNQTYNIASSDLYTVNGNVAKEAGNHIVTVTLKDKVNYVWADGSSEDLTYNFVIGKAIIAKPAADVTTFTYNGSNQTYNIALNDAYTVTNNVQKNAGSYTVTVTLKDKVNTCWADGSTDDLTFTFTIAKAKVSKPNADTSTFTYNGEDQTYNIAPNDAYTVSGNVAKDAGTHKVTVSLNDPNNFEWADGTTDNLVFDFIIGEKVCINHWFLIGILVLGLALAIVFYFFVKNELLGIISSGVFLAGSIISSFFCGCGICIAFMIINFVLFIGSLGLFIVKFVLMRQADASQKEEQNDNEEK